MIWFTADTHFGHTNIIKYCNRPFHNVQEMDAAILAHINQKVKPHDILWILGDFSFGSQEYYRNAIKCKNVNLIRGNHDMRVNKNYLEAVFDRVEDMHVIKERTKIFLCHYAMKVWPHKHHGAMHLFGHSHGLLQNPEPYSLDVGVDANNYKPLSINDIDNTMRRLWQQ